VISRRSFVLTGILAAASRPRGVLGASSVLVEDWAGQPLGARGVPRGWTTYETPGGHPRYDFTIVEDGGRRALELRSTDEHSTIAKEIAIDLAEMPVLEWAWRVIT
jgi:Protein of unknown function (DUF3047)